MQDVVLVMLNKVSQFQCVVLVGHGDPAIFRLVVHFKKVLQEIEGNFRQLRPTKEISKELARNKKKGYFFTAADCANLWKTVNAGWKRSGWVQGIFRRN